MDKKAIVVVTGGPGFGKTSIIKELATLGYPTGEEYARVLIEQQVAVNGDILPWKNAKRFQIEVMEQRIHFYQSVKEGEIAFTDRGLVDQLAFIRFRGLRPLSILLENIQKYPYEPVVFITPPWREIYSTDNIRDESFEEAELLHRFICNTYKELGYELVEIPKTDAVVRARFIVDYLGKIEGLMD
ncbi:MAG: AAA family ATPase [Mangrovibacterium sp.]